MKILDTIFWWSGCVIDTLLAAVVVAILVFCIQRVARAGWFAAECKIRHPRHIVNFWSLWRWSSLHEIDYIDLTECDTRVKFPFRKQPEDTDDVYAG